MEMINRFFDNSKFIDAKESDARNLVFTKSLAIEKYMSMYLAFILDINEYEKSTSFGNTSQSLSFNQKINLFTDLKYLTKGDKNKLLAFSEIRNQFAHNSQCVTFEDTFNSDIKNRLKKEYTSLSDLDVKEEEYLKVFENLFSDIKLMFENLRQTIYSNKASEYLLEIWYMILNETFTNLKNNPGHFNVQAIQQIQNEVIRLFDDKYELHKQEFRKDIQLKIGKYFND
ncbi:MAG: hypothetical protein ACKVOU_09570 [Cytophagales bacterium]